MQQDQHKTKVIFRKFSDGEIIALFPELPGDSMAWRTCLSYVHVGQHSAASVGLGSITSIARPEEYKDLRQELESMGYNLRVCKRFTHKDLQTRIKAIQGVK